MTKVPWIIPASVKLKGVDRASQVFSDPIGSSFYHKEIASKGIDWDLCGERLILLSIETFKNT